MSEESNKPKGVVRCGGIKVTTWENEKEFNGEKRKVLSHTIVKSYKVKDSDEWKDTNSLNTNELPKVITMLQKVYGESVITKEE